MKSEDVTRRKWTEAERRVVGRAAHVQEQGDDSDINFGDVPRLTDEQLASMIRLRDVRR